MSGKLVLLDEAEEKPNTIWVPVQIKRPVEHRTESYDIKLHINEVDLDEVDTLSHNSEDDREFLSEITFDWKGIADSDGEAVPFTQENYAQLLKRAWFCSACTKAVFERLAGGSGGRKRKN